MAIRKYKSTMTSQTFNTKTYFQLEQDCKNNELNMFVLKNDTCLLTCQMSVDRSSVMSVDMPCVRFQMSVDMSSVRCLAARGAAEE